MSKGKQKTIFDSVMDGMTTTVIFKRPFTCVLATYLDAGSRLLSAVGFSKVSWPDQWSEAVGYMTAAEKAARDITEQILGRHGETYLTVSDNCTGEPLTETLARIFDEFTVQEAG